MTAPITDGDIAQALRSAGLPSGRTFVAAVRDQKNKRDKGLLAHASSIAQLRIALEELVTGLPNDPERILPEKIGSHIVRLNDHIEYAKGTSLAGMLLGSEAWAIARTIQQQAAEIDRLQGYVTGFRREEDRADRLAEQVDNLNGQITQLKAENTNLADNIPANLAEAVEHAVMRSQGLDPTEVCGLEVEGGDDCNSGTCCAAHFEDHDPAHARAVYRKIAQAAIAAMKAHMASDGVVQADRDAVAHYNRVFPEIRLIDAFAAPRRAAAAGNLQKAQIGKPDPRDDEIEALRAKLAETEAHAGRYRWLRDNSCPPHNFYISVPDEFHGVRYSPQEVDAYIDEARAKLAKSGPQS